ncbi:MAG TPA: 16S rRNA (guanine(527)-N(7))-methyltransferase RsmG [Kofleriaceae bacterium]|jgi:16S rRNA (guanine527-N7)-methyltransferase|nr:16S rRNA (guanine(527)-N(7))-methyltransferase RsmG [Kofleriaceae bacterium]
MNSAQLEAFLDLFEKWNRSINLSGATTRGELKEHVDDCLHVVPLLETVAPVGVLAKVLDVGSGGGFPVVIAAICAPTIEFVSLEPVHKKHAFLRTAARELSLENLECLAERLEDHEHHDYDAAMSRATFDIREWLTNAERFVRPAGRVIGFEGQLRADLVDVERISYVLAGKPRAIVSRIKRST